MGRRQGPSDEEGVVGGDEADEVRIDRGKKKRKAWPRGRRRQEEAEEPSELDPLWEVRPKR